MESNKQCPVSRQLATLIKYPQVGKPAPTFSGTAVVNGKFETLKLTDYLGKYVVLFFYPMDFTFVCPTELVAFNDKLQDFKSLNCELIGCSTDSQFTHLAWLNTPRKQGGLGGLNYPLLADKNASISSHYGVYDQESGVCFRGLFIIDKNGVLRQMTVNDLPVGRCVDEVLRLVKAFQFTDQHGEVCPANWEPGRSTMKPDPEGSKKYFQNQ